MVPSSADAMNRAGHRLLTGAGFAEDQDWGVAYRHFPGQRQDRLQHWTLADDPIKVRFRMNFALHLQLPPEGTISFHALYCVVGSHTLRGKFPASAFWTATLSFSDPVVPPLRVTRSALRRSHAAREQWSRAAGFPACHRGGGLAGL